MNCETILSDFKHQNIWGDNAGLAMEPLRYKSSLLASSCKRIKNHHSDKKTAINK